MMSREGEAQEPSTEEEWDEYNSYMKNHGSDLNRDPRFESGEIPLTIREAPVMDRLGIYLEWKGQEEQLNDEPGNPRTCQWCGSDFGYPFCTQNCEIQFKVEAGVHQT